MAKALKSDFAGETETGVSSRIGLGLQFSLFYKKAKTYPHIHATEVLEVGTGKKGRTKQYWIWEFHHSDGMGTTFHWKEQSGTFEPKYSGPGPTVAQWTLAKDFVDLFSGNLAAR